MKEKHELAYEDYLSGMKYKDIATKYDVSISAVKSWKSRYWKNKKVATKKSKVATKKVAKNIAEKIIDESEELNEEHQLFCIYYLKYHNQVKAYLKVKPDVTYASACTGANRWMKNESIQKEIKRLKKELYTEALLDPQDIIQKYIDIAFADITDYATFKDGWVSLKDSNCVDGIIIQEVKQGKSGISIKFGDRMKALDFLSKHMNMATDEQKAKIELLKAQTSKLTEKEDEGDSFVEDSKNAIDGIVSQIQDLGDDE